MTQRALVLASILLLAGCGGAMESAREPGPSGGSVKSADRKPDSALGGEGQTRGILLEEPTDTTKKDPEKAFEIRLGAPPPEGASRLVGAGRPEERKESDKGPPPPPPGGGGIRAAVVDSGTPLGNGRLTQPQIAKILEQGGDVFGECYTLGAGGANKDFRATVTVKATIGPTGKVNAVEVTKSTANSPKVDACVADAFKKVKFPAPADGATSVITFPITFNGIEAVN